MLPNNKNNNKGKNNLKNNEGNKIQEEETADYIINYFTNIGPNLAKTFNKEWEYFGTKSENDISDINVNRVEVVRLLKEIDISNSSGLNRISSNCLKDACLSLSSQLTHIIKCQLNMVSFQMIGKLLQLSLYSKVVKIMKYPITDQYRYNQFQVKF